MRVTLIQPPHKSECAVPLGLLCLASYIKKYNHNTSIVDLNVVLKKHLFSPDYLKKVTKVLLGHQPDILGFSVICSTLPISLLIAEEFKRRAPHIPIIFGGPEVTFEEVELLKTFKQIDLIVRGEGEITLVGVIKALEDGLDLSKILGITFREGDKIKRNADRPFIDDLDSLPKLDFSVLPHFEKYNKGTLEAGRGCPFHCTFCSTSKMWKSTLRMKSAQRLAKELRRINSIFKKRGDFIIDVSHDNFLASKKVVNEFLPLVANKGFAWGCSSRLDQLDRELIIKLKRAGCQYLFIGIESGSPAIQKKIKKKLPIRRLPNMLDMLYRNDIGATLSFIVGFPGEKKSQINQTLRMALASRTHVCFPLVQVHQFCFLKGSELFYKAKKNALQCQFRQGQADFSPFSTDLSSENVLIREYPHIFPSYYYLSEKDIPSEFIKKVCIAFCFMTLCFPFTTLLLTRRLSLQPIELCETIISFLEAARADWIFFHTEIESFNYYYPFMQSFIQKNSNALIKECFLHEELFARSSFAKESNCSKSKIKMFSRPKICKKVIIREYKYDVMGFMWNTKLKLEKGNAKRKYHVAYVPGRIAKAVPLSPSLYYLLLLCDGTTSVREIIDEIQDKKSEGGKIKENILGKLRFLQEEGIIYAS